MWYTRVYLRSSWISLVVLFFLLPEANSITNERRQELKLKAKEMFYHGFDSYMKYAFPYDELNPIHCVGKGSDRINLQVHNPINDVLGDYSLTLVDTLDTFIVFNDTKGFQDAVQNVIDNVSFDVNSKVQVFELNIRALGGLLSAHLLASDSRFGFTIPKYNNELLDLALDLGKRLLPAFQNSRTGIPYPRVNLRYGVPKTETHETCTAGAGSLILEFGVLSRLTNDPRFENAARGALFGLWNRRTDLNLVGNVINMQTGQWVHTASSTGAGIDSFFEYLLKAYVLFGEIEYFEIFNEAYSAILRHIRDETGYLYRNVNMMSGSYIYGVLAGDLDNAIKSHLIYYNIWKKYQAMPERFNFYMKHVEIASYPLRPEFVESTYFLYRATRDPFYLEVGEMILQDLETYARVKCGYTSIKNVLTKKLDDRMETFVLSETFKYLYLLFDTDNMINLLDDNFVFTTEAHILPLSRQYLKKNSDTERISVRNEDLVCNVYEKPKGISGSILARPDVDYAGELVGYKESRLPPLDPNGKCETPQTSPLVLEVSFGEADVLNDLSNQLIWFNNGIITNNLKGLRLELSRRVDKRGYDVSKGTVNDYRIYPGQVLEIRDPIVKNYWVKQESYEVSIIRVYPNPEEQDIIRDNVLLVKRGDCEFVTKVLNAQLAGAKAVIVSSNDNILFQPASQPQTDSSSIFIPCVLVTKESGIEMEKYFLNNLKNKKKEKETEGTGGKDDKKVDSNVKVQIFPYEANKSLKLKNLAGSELLLVIHGHVVYNIRVNLNE
ncbi:21767_t:CDS:10 [Entrophospora sp. SA101]|nr:21767_t:CDS:10 [Entrophospora sp. SA101]